MKRCILSLATAFLLVPRARSFCLVPQPRLVCAEYYANTAVVEARLVRATANHDRDDPVGVLSHDYEMSVGLSLRGNIGRDFRVHEENDSGRASFDWIAGRNYLLFLTYDSQAKAWELDGCGNSGPLSKVVPALARIKGMQRHPNQGMIQGQVSVENLSGGIPGVQVEARGSAGTFTAHTNSEGYFLLHVPIGHYELHTTQDGLVFRDSELSYENSNDLNIQPGGCVQVQIMEVGGKWPAPKTR